MRRMIERLSRGMILRRKLPKRYGDIPFYATPEAGLKFWSHNSNKWDPHLFELCDEYVKEDSIIWDVGANIGLFSFPAAVLAGQHGRVLAIEPDVFFD